MSSELLGKDPDPRSKYLRKIGIERDLKKEAEFRTNHLLTTPRSDRKLKNWILNHIEAHSIQAVPISCIIFDYDDTLFPTSFLAHCYGFDPKTEAPNLSRLSTATLHDLEVLEESCIKLISRAFEITKEVFIVTNGSLWWIKYSLQSCMPKLFRFMSDIKMRVISAKDDYMFSYPNDVVQWKARSFLDIRADFEQEKTTVLLYNIMSIGDSRYEAEATQAVSRAFPNALMKIIIFTKAPTIADLHIQIELLLPKLRQIADLGENVSFSIQRKSNQPLPEERRFDPNLFDWDIELCFDRHATLRSNQIQFNIAKSEFGVKTSDFQKRKIQKLVEEWSPSGEASSL